MRRGVVLLEILLSLAIFVGAGLAVGGAVGRAMSSMARAQERTIAADLAWSAIARIEAGESGVGAINGPVEGDSSWSLAIETTPTEHGGLVLVEASVLRLRDGVAAGSPAYTARQLVRLRDELAPALDDGWVGDGPVESPFGAGGLP